MSIIILYVRVRVPGISLRWAACLRFGAICTLVRLLTHSYPVLVHSTTCLPLACWYAAPCPVRDAVTLQNSFTNNPHWNTSNNALLKRNNQILAHSAILLSTSAARKKIEPFIGTYYNKVDMNRNLPPRYATCKDALSGVAVLFITTTTTTCTARTNPGTRQTAERATKESFSQDGSA